MVVGSNPSKVRFSTDVQTGIGAQPVSFLNSGYQISFPGVKQSMCGVDHTPSYSVEVKERIQLYLTPFLAIHELF
jgi:hypothetical protein